MAPEPEGLTRSFNEAHRRAHTGDDLSRPIALADGVFAFALTLLVLQLTIPLGLCTASATSAAPSAQACSGLVAQALANDYRAFLGYVETFLIIAIWWVSHHRVFRFIERYDSALLWLNLCFLLTVAVAPFVVGLFLQYPDTSPALFLFSLEMAMSGFLLAAIWAYAGYRNLLSAEADPVIRKYLSTRGWALPAFFLAGAFISLVSPSVVQFVWVGAFVVGFAMGRYG
ncbi:MAG TPA: TMEM175 family protein [Thermoplasmata archaeon]|nr:TMEM175 family protein [Thermoplasmata archaeon]